MIELRTQRLTLRAFRSSDAASLQRYRNDPSTAQFQSWTLPYRLEKAQSMVDDLAAMDGPVDGEWFGLVITPHGSPDDVLGDVVMLLGWSGRSAELGYNLAPVARGFGYAHEAAGRVIDWLFTEHGVRRIHASLHPDNVASARVLEGLGFVYEGTARQSYWVGETCSDDPLYGLLPADWEAWTSRPRHRPSDVSLEELTPNNARIVGAVRTHRSQERFVTAMAGNFREMAVPPIENDERLVPWPRAIVADGEIVGFVMTTEPIEGGSVVYLWRLLIDRMHQRRGIGDRVLDLVIAQSVDWGVATLMVSYVPGIGSPEPFYLRRGFVPTGDIDDGEIVAALRLT